MRAQTAVVLGLLFVLSVCGIGNAQGDPQLDARIQAEADRVRAMPPVHERDEPWSVSVEEFSEELQPLRLAQMEERLEFWLTMLQDQIRQRNRLQIAAQQTEDSAFRQALLEEAATINGRVTAVVERTQTLMDAIAARGGDTSEARRYIANAANVRLNLADPAVLVPQALAWLRSPEGGVALGVRLVTFVIILIIAWIISRIVGGIVNAAVNRVPNASSLLRNFLVGGAKRIVMLIGLIVAVSRLGIDISPLVAAIAAAGLVIGLALQGTLSNFASGILILFYKPYDVGDVIDGGGVVGKVEAMSLVSTRVATFDNRVIYVPNNQIWNGTITNITARDTRRVDLVIGVAYGADLKVAHDAIAEVVNGHEKILPDPAPVIKVNELADNSVNFIVRPWSKAADYWDVHWDLTRGIKEKLDQVGVGIPFPQRDLYLPEGLEVTVKNG